MKQLEYKSRSFKVIKFRKKEIKNTVFDKDVTTLLLQIGTSSGGFEHPVLKCSSLPRNVLEGGLNPLALPPHHKGIFSGEIFLQFVKEMQIFVIKPPCYVKLASIETT